MERARILGAPAGDGALCTPIYERISMMIQARLAHFCFLQAAGTELLVLTVPMKEHYMETSRQSSSLFVRKSTGLVREASAFDAMVFNAVFSAPVGATLAWGVFFALSLFPGADIVTATLISFVINAPIVVMMALMASSMPRTGGDYVWVSRILSPPLATVSNFGAAFSAMIGATFWARYFPVFALGPILVGLGVFFNNSTMVEWGTNFQTKNDWI